MANVTCPKCNGTGRRWISLFNDQTISKTEYLYQSKCDQCDGLGICAGVDLVEAYNNAPKDGKVFREIVTPTAVMSVIDGESGLGMRIDGSVETIPIQIPRLPPLRAIDVGEGDIYPTEEFTYDDPGLPFLIDFATNAELEPHPVNISERTSYSTFNNVDILATFNGQVVGELRGIPDTVHTIGNLDHVSLPFAGADNVDISAMHQMAMRAEQSLREMLTNAPRERMPLYHLSQPDRIYRDAPQTEELHETVAAGWRAATQELLSQPDFAHSGASNTTVVIGTRNNNGTYTWARADNDSPVVIVEGQTTVSNNEPYRETNLRITEQRGERVEELANRVRDRYGIGILNESQAIVVPGRISTEEVELELENTCRQCFVEQCESQNIIETYNKIMTECTRCACYERCKGVNLP